MHEQEGGAADVESYMKEQMDYWKSLSKEQQEELLSKMSPQERANAEGESRACSHAETNRCPLACLQLTTPLTTWPCGSLRVRQADDDDHYRRVAASVESNEQRGAGRSA